MGGSLRLPDVEVRRIAAKVTCRITIADPDIEVRSLRLMSIPRVVRLFGAEDAPSAVAADYMNGSERPAAGMSAESVFYSFPNMQGTVPSIADQRQKNRDNAPDNASYLLIRAVKGDRILAYTVYLGGNNTSDFNVRANTHYRLDISILGDSEVDTRSGFVSRARTPIRNLPDGSSFSKAMRPGSVSIGPQGRRIRSPSITTTGTTITGWPIPRPCSPPTITGCITG